MDNTTIYEFLQEKSVTPTGPGSYSDSTEMSNALKVFKRNNQSTLEDEDVVFYDYDGSIVYTYSAEDFLKLSEMPANPSHEGLIAQGWNWDFGDAQSYVRKYGILDVGQMYITDDGTTRFVIDLKKSRTLELNFCLDETCIVDWGDNSELVTVNGNDLTAITTISHSYFNKGEYVISISGGNFILPPSISYGTSACSTLFSKLNGDGETIYDLGVLKAAYFGQNITSLGIRTLAGCYNLKEIIIPNSSFTLEHECFFQNSIHTIVLPKTVEFNETYSMGLESAKHIVLNQSSILFSINNNNLISRYVIPENNTAILQNMFYNCNLLKKVIIPETVTTIGGKAFYGTGLKEIVIPSTVTKIGNFSYYEAATFSKMKNLTSIKFESSQPPELSHNDVFYGTGNITFYIPRGSLEAYTSAQYYPDPEIYTYVEY